MKYAYNEWHASLVFSITFLWFVTPITSSTPINFAEESDLGKLAVLYNIVILKWYQGFTNNLKHIHRGGEGDERKIFW